eukprot:scaffold96573_cov52-Attheya_sp.AAC.4
MQPSSGRVMMGSLEAMGGRRVQTSAKRQRAGCLRVRIAHCPFFGEKCQLPTSRLPTLHKVGMNSTLYMYRYIT